MSLFTCLRTVMWIKSIKKIKSEKIKRFLFHLAIRKKARGEIWGVPPPPPPSRMGSLILECQSNTALLNNNTNQLHCPSAFRWKEKERESALIFSVCATAWTCGCASAKDFSSHPSRRRALLWSLATSLSLQWDKIYKAPANCPPIFAGTHNRCCCPFCTINRSWQRPRPCIVCHMFNVWKPKPCLAFPWRRLTPFLCWARKVSLKMEVTFPFWSKTLKANRWP